MRIFLAEYAVATGNDQFLEEGCAMLHTLASSFTRLGHSISYPTAGIRLSTGKPLPANPEDFHGTLRTGEGFDAGLVIAPDELLAGATRIFEKHTCNLGSSPETIDLCADKLLCTRKLQQHSIPVPRTTDNTVPPGKWVIKPRWGCGSEKITIIDVRKTMKLPPGVIATEYIEGEHLSVSLIASENRILPLAINRQNIHQHNNTLTYHGSKTPCETHSKREILNIATKTATILGCRGYTGIDLINSTQPFIVDVNPRPTTSIIPLSKILTCELAELILQAKNNQLPEKIETKGCAEIKLTEKNLQNIAR